MVNYMKVINYRDYNSNMGTLIDVENIVSYSEKHLKEAINIPYEKILSNHTEYLNKNNRYFITCSKGLKSKKAIRILEFYGYDVTQVIK